MYTSSNLTAPPPILAVLEDIVKQLLEHQPRNRMMVDSDNQEGQATKCTQDEHTGQKEDSS